MAKWLHFLLSCFLLFVPSALGVELELVVMVSNANVFDTSQVIPAVNLALEAVNNWSLPFTLSYNATLHSQCEDQRSVQIIQEALTQPSSSLVAIIGCGCSTSTEAVATMPELQDIPLISYASTSPSITNGGSLPHFLRTVPSSAQVPSALVSFINFFEWTQVLLVSEALVATIQEINSTLGEANITTELVVPQENPHHLAIIAETDKRIFVLDTTIATASQSLCQGYWSGKYYPSYAWLIVNNFAQEQWWNLLHQWTSNCTKSQLSKVLNYSVVFEAVPMENNDDRHTSTSGLTQQDFRNLYNEALPTGAEGSTHAAYAYDSILALASVLNTTKWLETDSNTSSPINLETIVEELKRARINGVSGVIEFDNSGERQNTVVQIDQLRRTDQGLEPVIIAHYQDNHIELSTGESASTIWPSGTPSDGVPIMVITHIHYAVMVIGMLMGLAGLVYTAILLALFIYYRNKPIVKLTSPNLNYIIMFGVTCMYLSVILYSIPGFTQDLVAPLCEIDALLAGELGYSVCFCITLVKVWRVYYIFHIPKPRKKVPKDWQLIIGMLILFLPEFIVNVVLLTVDFSLHAPALFLNKEMPPVTNSSTGEVQEFYIWECHMGVLTYIDEYFTVTYKAIQHAAALYMTFRTRKIKVTALNDYWSNTIIVCTNTVIMIVLLITLAAFKDYPNTFTVLIVSCIFLGCTVFVTLGFVPKMVLLYQDPEGKFVFDMSAEMKQNISSTLSVGKSAGPPPANHSSIRSVIDSFRKPSIAEQQ